MVHESGNISINAENIFPIIKKWLYSDKDIFIRELASNCSDAISKHRKLASIGEAQPDGDGGAYSIVVEVDKPKGTLAFIDNGVGMDADEVKSYINQIAFSGARDFLEKYKDKLGDGDQIIGHFGLGFYSAFMVSSKVEIDTLSWRPGAEAVHWASEGGMDFMIGPSKRETRGTTVTLTMAEDGREYLDEWKAREALRKYCAFLPFPIAVTDVEREAREAKEAEEKKAKESKAGQAETAETAASDAGPGDGGDGLTDGGSEGAARAAAKKAQAFHNGKWLDAVNDTSPLWLKAPKDCSDDEYKDFYRKVFMDFDDPLFWIHLNMDYPFNLKGILYFPKLKHEFETMEGQIKLYYNQVFVADNIKEVIPEFLLLLKGCIDCPDLPLNVSRSFLQNDTYVKKISTHITKKVADKLTSLFEGDRESYERYWDDISPFVKYGCIKEQGFYDRVKDAMIYKSAIGSGYVTMKAYLESAKGRHENTVFYVTDEKRQAQYIRLFKENGMDAVVLGTLLDTHFVSFLETKENDVKLRRIDSDISDGLLDEAAGGEKLSKDEAEEMKKTLEGAFRRAVGDDKLVLRLEPLKSDAIPAVLLLSEYARRMQDMSRMYGSMGRGMDMSSMLSDQETLVLNTNSRLVKSIARMERSGEKRDEADIMCQHVYDMAVMGNKPLEPDAMTRFLERSGRLLERLAE